MGNGFSVKAKANAEADIYIYEDVGFSFYGGVTAKQFADELKALGNVDTINLHLNSPGGDVFDGLAIYRLLVDHKAKVIAHVDGLAASIASVIAMAGNEIRVSESGYFMVHNAWGGCVGPADDMRKMADLLDQTSSGIADVYVARAKAKPADVKAWMNDETWFTGAEAIAAGLADTLVENLRVAAHYDPSKHNFRKAPTALTKSEPVARPSFDAVRDRFTKLKAQQDMRRIRARA